MAPYTSKRKRQIISVILAPKDKRKRGTGRLKKAARFGAPVVFGVIQMIFSYLCFRLSRFQISLFVVIILIESL